MTAEQAENAADLVTFFLHDDHEQEEKTEPAVGHDGGYYRRLDGTCRYCEGRHPLEGAA